MKQPMLKIASWNVNSLNVRGEQALNWIRHNNIDVLAVQETKVPNEKFPLNIYQDNGLYCAYDGQKSYNGVAFISRLPLQDIYIEPIDIAERRIIAATVHNIRIINLYVPNGSDLTSPKYCYKLAWLERVKIFLSEQLKHFSKLVVLGDFNIAPQDIDVHDPNKWKESVLVSDDERALLKDIQALGLVDSFRHTHPQRTLYSWWDYRAASFRRNHGLRIDLILLSRALMDDCIEAEIDIDVRKHEHPSDHAPVWIKLTS